MRLPNISMTFRFELCLFPLKNQHKTRTGEDKFFEEAKPYPKHRTEPNPIDCV